MTANGFEVGDIVEWTSQSAGVIKTKRGAVERIIAVGERAKVYNPGASRDHVSYQVKVGSRRYWPRVSQLRLVGTEKAIDLMAELRESVAKEGT